MASGPSSACDPRRDPHGRIHHAEKRVIGLDNAAFELPDEDADDVGVDQAPNLRFAFCEIAVGVRKRQRCRCFSASNRRDVFDRDHRLVGEGLEKRDLLVVERSDLPFAVLELLQWGVPSRSNGVASVVRWPSRFASLLPTGYSLVLRGEIMDMNRPTIACGSSGHRVSVCGKALAGMDIHRNFPV